MVKHRTSNGAELIGLDWGSSSLRAMLIGANGAVLETRSSAQGASTLDGSAAAFVAVLDALIGDWRETVPQLPIWACGMVGSQHGWREVPYASCPTDAATLAESALTVAWHDRTVHLAAGLRCESAAGVPDVMRGEETQVLGALELDPTLGERSCIVMPGTHSKWAQVADGSVRSFATHMTGEIFAVLRQHSVLGRLMPADSVATPQAFEAGVLAARSGAATGLLHQMFAVRTLGLTGRLAGAALPDYLSGLLIGHELHAGLYWRGRAQLGTAPLLLVGEPALCQRYALALNLFDQAAVRVMPNTAAAGLWRLSRATQGVL
jgi:2-dehydro-3-deoxygalactonokinase